MNSSYQCIPCFLRQSIEAISKITQDPCVTEKCIRRILRETSEFDFSKSPPEMGQVIHQILREESGNPDPYLKIKNQSTQYAAEMVHEASISIRNSEDPFTTALYYAIAGNVMDFALSTTWDSDKLWKTFEQVKTVIANKEMVLQLKKELMNANQVLYIGDNAGETVFDRLFIEYFPQKNRVFYAVKNSPIINDATLIDAQEAQIHTIATLLSNGNNAPGTVLKQCSPEFIEIFNKADVVIAKGQANLETLHPSTRNIYHLTQIKCPVIAEYYQYPLGEWVITDSQHLNQQISSEWNLK